MSKKAQIGSGFTDIFMFLSIVVIAFIFFIILNFKGCGKTSILNQHTSILTSRANLFLLTYLRAPAYGIENTTMENLLIDYFIFENKSVRKEIIKNTETFLNSIPACTYIEINKEGRFTNKTLLEAESKYCDTTNYIFEFWCSSTRLPSLDSSNKIIVRGCVVLFAPEKDEGLTDYNFDFGQSKGCIVENPTFPSTAHNVKIYLIP